jgi:hypothetical protein
VIDRKRVTNEKRWGKMFSYILPAPRRFFLAVLACAMALGFGCAITPGQKYLHSSDIRGLDSVAVFVTSTDFGVYYEHGQGKPAPLAEFFGLAGPLLVMGWRTGQDSSHAKEIQRNIQVSQVEAALLDEFTRELRDNSKLTIITAASQTSSSANDRPASAVINLNIKEVALHRSATDEMRLEVLVHAELIRSGGLVLWQRDDKAQSRRSYTLDYYKEHGVPELESLVRRIGKRLAAEIIYAK